MAGADRNYNKSIVNKSIYFCDEHPDAPLIEDYRVGEMSCTECGKMLLDYILNIPTIKKPNSYKKRLLNAELSCVPNIPENCTVIDNDDGSSSAEPPRDSIAKNPLSSSNLTNTSSGPSPSTGVTKRPKKKRTFGFDLDALYHSIEIMAKQLDGNQEVIDLATNILCKKVHLMNNRIKRCCLPDYFVGACLYAAFIKTKIPRTMKEIQALSNSKSNIQIAKCYEIIAKDDILGLQHCETITIQDFILRFCENLRLPEEIINVALHIARQATTFVDNMKSRLPDTIAATAIYMATQKTPEHRLHVNVVAKKCCVGASTIRKAYGDMNKICDKLLSDQNLTTY